MYYRNAAAAVVVYDITKAVRTPRCSTFPLPPGMTDLSGRDRIACVSL